MRKKLHDLGSNLEDKELEYKNLENKFKLIKQGGNRD